VVRIYSAEIILAIEELHRHDIIYRDLKPDNVVLDEAGHAHLTDFGLSKEGVKMNKQTSSFCGSAAYLAPEMLRKAGHNHSLDWYLLGDLIYELLMGFPPFFSSDREKMFRNIQYAKLNLPTHLSREALSLLEGVLFRQLLNRNPPFR
jgi:protein-serine/threonine kinase